MRRAGIAVAMLIPIALLGVAGFELISHHPLAAPGERRPVAARPVPSCGSSHLPPGPLIGLAPGARAAPKLAAFTAGSGIRPSVVEYYRRFGVPFDAGYACSVAGGGALPLIQLLPRGIPLAAIAAGRYDRYLTAYAGAVRRYDRPLALSFGHEMNGDWETWGWKHTAPAVFRAAWRHIVTVFRANGASSVIWVWNINRLSPAVSGARQWWPGARYVTWVGVDAYYRHPWSTFASVFAPTLRRVRAFTGDPVLIAETAAGRSPRLAVQIQGLMVGVATTPGVLGFVWFDINAKERWRIDGDPAILAAFRGSAAVRR